MTHGLEATLLTFIHELPLELFVFIASFIEEVIAPIPSAAVLVVTGSFAAVQDRSVIELIPLVLIAALGKSIGAILVYYLAEKVSGIFFSRLGSFMKVDQTEVNELGKRISGGPRDYLILTLCRALPIIPSSVVSVGSGILKIPFRLFIISTIIGTVVRDSVFIYAGYEGTDFLNTITTRSVNIESLIQMAVVTGMVGVFVYIYFKRRKPKAAPPDSPN